MPKQSFMSDDELDANVEFFMNQHIGDTNKIDRWEMVEKIFNCIIPAHERNDDHPQDRAVRESVSRLRKRGVLICDMGDGDGRYLASNWDEFIRFYGYFVKPISAKAQTARAMLKSAKQKFPSGLQPSLFDPQPVMIEEFDDVVSVL